MAKASMLILFLTSFWGCDAEFTMTQPPSVSTSIGETVKISCTLSGERISSTYISWYQQKPGSTPMMLIYSNDNRASGISDRLSGSVDSSANTATLTISSAQEGDEADYHCFSYYSTNKRVFGGGTQLTITGQQTVPPKVTVFPPSPEEIQTRSKATLVCLMTEFHPGVVQVEWKADGNLITEGVETTRPTKQNDKYLASSYLTVSGSDWKSRETYTCKVTHQGQVIEKSVKSSECP